MRFDDCSHAHIVDPPPGKYLRVCLDCLSRLVECNSCPAVTHARPDITDSGWRKGENDGVRWTACPDCWARVMDRVGSG